MATGYERDVREWELPPDVLAEILKDRTTGRNIRWAADGYGFAPDSEILAEQICDAEHPAIRPRVDKSREEQKSRTKSRAEVFTPTWVCKIQNGVVEESNPLRKSLKQSWREYLAAPVLEITCGEAPYLASRYDATTGKMIPILERVGLLDRKLRVASRKDFSRSERGWLANAMTALKATYGFEYQGDNVLLARENLLASVVEYYWWRWHGIESTDFVNFPHQGWLQAAAMVVSWNIWQMDGIKLVVPFTCKSVRQTNWFGDLVQPCPACAGKKGAKHTGDAPRIMDWATNKPIEFASLLHTGGK